MNDELILKAIQIAKENDNGICISILQRKLRIGCIKCLKLIDILEDKGVIAPYNPNEKIRKVLVK